MSSKDSPTTENEALLKEVEALEQQVAALNLTIRRARTTRLVIFFVALAIVVGSVWMFYRLGMQVKSPENLQLLAQKAKDHFTGKSSDYVQKVKTIANNSIPVVKEAFLEQVKKDTPKYNQVAEEQRLLLVSNLRDQVRDQVMHHFAESGGQFKAILQEEFPEVDDPAAFAKMNANLDQIMGQLVEKYYAEDLQKEILKIYDQWDTFPVAEREGAEEVSLEQQLIANLLELVSLRLNSPPPAPTDTVEPSLGL